MSEPVPTVRAPYTAQELLDCGWVRRTRAAILADGVAVCLGVRCILAQSINSPDLWLPILLPNGGTQLTDHAQGVIVIKWLEGDTPLPESAP